ncbi:hypothetical protein ACQPZF_09370 [Actinosynnema sp. CS-041913]|uniref:hypothetical protein n=1 Tax=Actinosynnema sp. CS-041913 TaxID=3239917 RepID=UPI003D8EEFDB
MTERLTTEDFVPPEKRQTDQSGYDEQPYDREPRDNEPFAEEPTAHQQTVDELGVHEPETGDVPAEQPAAEQPRSADEPLFTADEADGYQGEWRALQADFVDDPRDAVQRADELVAQVIQSLATTFAEHKRSLEGQWQQGGQADTEELRLALRRYRSFFDRLLSV